MKEKTRSRCLVLSIVRYIFIVLGFLFLWLNFEDKILYVFDTYVQPYLWIKQDCWVTAIAIVFTLLFLVYVAKEFYKFCHNRRKMPPYLTVSLLVLFVMYIKYRIEGKCECYDDTPIAYLDAYALVDIAFAILGLWSCLSKKKPIVVGEEFINDEPETKMINDKLDYSGFVEKLAEKLSRQRLKKAFSVGVVGSWGVGKTTFMNFLKESLKKEGEFIIVDFNPRNSLNAQNIQEDFFSKLCSALSPYHMGLSSTLKKYMRALQLMESNNVAAIFSFLHRLQGNEVAKRQVEIVLEGMPKKVAIFIDDLDRLVVDEILEVFKLIDVNANFPNMIFVTAYDKTITNRMVSERLHLSNNSIFIDKFFDYEMIIPIRPYNSIFRYIRDEITTRIITKQEEIVAYEADINGVESIFSHYITTMRDAKRYVNLFVSDYMKLKGEVDVRDYLLVTLLKYKSPEEHRRLYNEKQFLDDMGQNRLCLIKYEEKFKKEYQYEPIIKALFPDSEVGQKPIYGRINYANTFDVYFISQLEGGLSQNEMKGILGERDLNEVRKQVEDWQKDKKDKYLIEFLSTLNIYKTSREEFERYVNVVLCLCSETNSVYELLKPLVSLENIKKLISSDRFKNTKEYTHFLKKHLHKHPNCYLLTRRLLLDLLRPNPLNTPIVLTRKELLDMGKHFLKYYLKTIPKFTDLHLNVLGSCIEGFGTYDNEILNKECCSLVKEAIIRYPNNYIKNFVEAISYRQDPTRGNIYCERYWEQIFVGAETLRQLIYDEKHNNLENIDRVRNYWKLYEKNDYTPIQVDGEWDVEGVIQHDLKEMMEQLEDLDDINDSLKNIRQSKQHFNDAVSIRRAYNELQRRLDDNKLHIAYAGYIGKEIHKDIDWLNRENPPSATNAIP